MKFVRIGNAHEIFKLENPFRFFPPLHLDKKIFFPWGNRSCFFIGSVFFFTPPQHRQTKQKFYNLLQKGKKEPHKKSFWDKPKKFPPWNVPLPFSFFKKIYNRKKNSGKFEVGLPTFGGIGNFIKFWGGGGEMGVGARACSYKKTQSDNTFLVAPAVKNCTP